MNDTPKLKDGITRWEAERSEDTKKELLTTIPNGVEMAFLTMKDGRPEVLINNWDNTPLYSQMPFTIKTDIICKDEVSTTPWKYPRGVIFLSHEDAKQLREELDNALLHYQAQLFLRR